MFADGILPTPRHRRCRGVVKIVTTHKIPRGVLVRAEMKSVMGRLTASLHFSRKSFRQSVTERIATDASVASARRLCSRAVGQKEILMSLRRREVLKVLGSSGVATGLTAAH